MRFFWGKRPSGFSRSSTADEVTREIDGRGLTAIVTGASSGIGAETARVLALRGVHVIMGIRNMEAGREVRGVYGIPFTLSEDNVELQFATNYLGHFLLTHLLLDTMKQTARESGREGRIVNVSSVAHRFAFGEGIRFDKLNDPSGYISWQAYCQTKLANILHTHQLTKLLKEAGATITANSLHPGLVDTNILMRKTWKEDLVLLLTKYIIKNVHQGAATTCYLALHPQVNGISGGYFSHCKLVKPSSKARDDTLAQKLWDFSMDMVKMSSSP